MGVNDGEVAFSSLGDLLIRDAEVASSERKCDRLCGGLCARRSSFTSGGNCTERRGACARRSVHPTSLSALTLATDASFSSLGR